MNVREARAAKRIGETKTNKEGYTAKIVALSENRDHRGGIKYIGKFTGSGYEFEVDSSNWAKGSFKDYGQPTVYGVGYSRPGAKKDNLSVYKMWVHMLERCYVPSYHAYDIYGGAGVRVSDRWLYFKHFEQDIKSLTNYDKYLESPRKYSLDKDILSKEVKLYSRDTCMFASKLEQAQAQERVKKVLCIPEKGEPFIANSKHEACKLTGVQNANLYKVLKGERSHAKGYRFKEIS